MADQKRVLLVVPGGIAAFKCLEIVRKLRINGHAVRCILTRAGAQFVTPLSLETLSEEKVYQGLFSLTDESEIGHIELSRDADILVVAPATADIIAKMRAGIADDLATTVLLATDKPIMIAPAMNIRMWEHAATQDNIAILRARGITLIGPEEGDMACGEYGMGRMTEPDDLVEKIMSFLKTPNNAGDRMNKLAGKKALVTSGPTHEPMDPIRYIANRSSGRQGSAIAKALADQGANTVLISGPTNLTDPPGVIVRRVNSAVEMLAACKRELPTDIAVCVAAVSDWRIAKPAENKIKKNGTIPKLELIENPDILATLSQSVSNRPRLVIGFAAETGSVVDRAMEKLNKKGCDWIVANDVSPGTNTFGGTENTIHIVAKHGIDNWPTMSKELIGQKLAERIADYLKANT